MRFLGKIVLEKSSQNAFLGHLVTFSTLFHTFFKKRDRWNR